MLSRLQQQQPPPPPRRALVLLAVTASSLLSVAQGASSIFDLQGVPSVKIQCYEGTAAACTLNGTVADIVDMTGFTQVGSNVFVAQGAGTLQVSFNGNNTAESFSCNVPGDCECFLEDGSDCSCVQDDGNECDSHAGHNHGPPPPDPCEATSMASTSHTFNFSTAAVTTASTVTLQCRGSADNNMDQQAFCTLCGTVAGVQVSGFSSNGIGYTNDDPNGGMLEIGLTGEHEVRFACNPPGDCDCVLSDGSACLMVASEDAVGIDNNDETGEEDHDSHDDHDGHDHDSHDDEANSLVSTSSTSVETMSLWGLVVVTLIHFICASLS